MSIRLMRESIIVLAIGLLDLVVTVALIGGHAAREGNPIMAYYLQFGIGAFVLAKLCLLVPPIIVAEWSNIYKPVFTRWMMRGAIAAYLGSYLVLFFTVNVAPRLNASAAICVPPAIRVAEHVR